MPTYEYACGACNHEWEIEQKISEDPLKKCPKCGKNKARRLVGSGNFILKGGGWYADLYSSSGNKPAKKDDASSAADSSPSSDSSTTKDTTTPAKADPAPAKGEGKSKKKPAKSE